MLGQPVAAPLLEADHGNPCVCSRRGPLQHEMEMVRHEAVCESHAVSATQRLRQDAEELHHNALVGERSGVPDNAQRERRSYVPLVHLRREPVLAFADL